MRATSIKRRNKILGVIATVFVLCAVAYFALLREAHAPAHCTFQLDLAEVRRLAGSLPGPRPREVRFERLTTFRFPGAAVVTGDSWSNTEMPVYAYQLAFPDRTVIIDTGMSEPQATSMHAVDYDAQAWSRLTTAMGSAAAIYVTHEHGDHAGGLAAQAGDPATLAHAHLTRVQLGNLDRMDPIIFPPAGAAQLRPLELAAQTAVAPGVVLIAAPGHTPGSQLVYVQREDGTELLLLGDVAWHWANVARTRLPPRLAGWMLHADREQNLCELSTLHDLAQSEPRLHQIPGHDGVRVAELVQEGVLVRGFH